VSEKITADSYLQINGGEPLIKPETITLVIPKNIHEDTEFGTNIITQIKNPVEAMDSSNIKVVFDNNMYTLYMSRTPTSYRMARWILILENIEEIGTLRFIDYGKPLNPQEYLWQSATVCPNLKHGSCRGIVHRETSPSFGGERF
jgi:hypothetical protein